MQFLTDFADQQLLLPLGVTWAAVLAFSGWRRGALAWIAVMVGTLGCLAVLKVILLACGWRWMHGALQTPSGHTGAAALFYGGYALLLLRPRGVLGGVVLLAPPLVAALVGLSRIVLHAHTPAEVIAGGLVGCAGAYLLRPLAGPPPRVPIRPALLATALVLVLLHGNQLHAERALRHFTIDGLWPPAFCQRPAGGADAR